MNPHFTPEALKFLRGLQRNNDRDWFNPRKPLFERELKAPMLALIDSINAAMETFAPDHIRPPHKTMMRIYRDTRFSKDKRPYKPHIAAWWANHTMPKTSGAGFYLHISPAEVFLAAGVFMPERDQLLAIRRWLADNHLQYRALLKKIMKPRPSAEPFTNITPDALTRVPKGFPADHPAADLLRHRNFGVNLSLPSSLALEPSLSRQIIQHYKLAAPLVAQLNQAILIPQQEESDLPAKPRRPLF